MGKKSEVFQELETIETRCLRAVYSEVLSLR